jgi:hypothetical protein
MRLALGLTLGMVAGCTALQATQLADVLKPANGSPQASPGPTAQTAPLPTASVPVRPSASPSTSATPHIPQTPPPVRPTPSRTPSPTPVPTATAITANPVLVTVPTPAPTAFPSAYQTPDPAVTFRRTVVSSPYTGPITITIDPGMLGTASPAPFRFVGTDDGTQTSWQLFQPANGSDSVACDPNDPAQLTAKGIDPGTGDQTFHSAGMSLSIGGLADGSGQNRPPFRFALDHLVVYPKAESQLPAILSLVGGAQRGSGMYGFYSIGITPARGDLSRLAANMRAISLYGPTPLSAISFSSVNSARVFALSLMLLMERTDLCWSASMDALPTLP